MNISHLSKKDRLLQGLLAQTQHWQALEARLKQKLPPNLASHCHVACIDAGGCLIVYADNHLVAGRLKMLLPVHLFTLQELNSNIRSVQVKLRPISVAAPKKIKRQFSDAALESFDEAAAKTAHHPELAAALQRFARRRRP